MSARYAIGLTGGIGSGKSTVADLFAARGAAIIDTDLIAHQLSAPGGAAIPAIEAAFGADFLTAQGALNRQKMRELVFADPAQRQRLEHILHPLIGRQTHTEAAAAGGAYLMYVVPLLVESGKWRQRVDRIVVVDCSVETQIARVMARNNLSRAAVEAIMRSQASRADRLAAADDMIDNQAGMEAVVQQVDVLHERYVAAARAQQS
ncbi:MULTISPECIES: dephospho-CoA kinase [unclassified Undibacterium]|uniref:dephospho-CoA kinase n=1 Tax=unclassified Undibacterium TaxID=2630295 RepID=UPI002AC99C79|nr:MULTISPECIES: dephospho-CoA kinase [unclassified Undibacterium]MEB0138213.1 dephospho-CoA kinase [Undibacterium sp. CCC2.1]MEB0171626.1 dephospho-CoA kinase [Undibacterium sp. CCC1.1]MEB0175454.1 dephospho-CoA kinase [Undibacterium sp. CCC3.4]MEB0214826.1 dephospho-CoA kinase [Undibacterium sp. 5I2]WPX45313.1 dephospho-CoA kinase [Undibacterium sp. CCC3.4]